MKINKEQMIKFFTSNLGALALKIDRNTTMIEDNSKMICQQRDVAEEQKGDIKDLKARVAVLGKGGVPPSPDVRETLSPEYLWSRRSIRLWPVPGGDLWRNVGDFLLSTLWIPKLGKTTLNASSRAMIPGETN